MKRRLFWKILFSFWLTFFLTVQCTWLLFAILRPDSSFHRGVARLAVLRAATVIEQGGLVAFRAEADKWPSELRDHVMLSPVRALQDGAPILESSARAPDGQLFRISYSHQSRNDLWGILRIPAEVLIGGAGGGLVFSAVLAWYLTKPVQIMRSGFHRLAGGDFTTRLGDAVGRRRDEIADLAFDFDQMATQLQELVAARDRLLADVSHELRTPLARLNLAVGLARQDPAQLQASLERITEESRRLDEMVGELLTLSEMEGTKAPNDDYFDLSDVVHEIVEDSRYEASAKSIEIELDVEPVQSERIVRGSGKLIARAVENVLRNAVRYAPKEGKVEVSLCSREGQYRLAITDNGPGIGSDQIDLLFKPFAISADGSGFGLGLAIAQRAIAVSGGTISAHNRSSGGLIMTIILPPADLSPLSS